MGTRAGFQVINFDFHDDSPVYVPVGAPLEKPCVGMFMTSDFNAEVLLSVDGVNDFLLLPPSAFSTNFTWNAEAPSDEVLQLPAGTQFYIKRNRRNVPPTKGEAYLTLFYEI